MTTKKEIILAPCRTVNAQEYTPFNIIMMMIFYLQIADATC